MPWVVAYLTIGVLNVVGEATGRTALAQATKPLIILTLIAYTVAWRRRTWDAPMSWFVAGLVAALTGDVLLNIDTALGFMGGLAAFAVMQVLYVIAFLAVPGPGLVRAWKIAIVPYAVIVIALNVAISAGVGDLRIPVLVYSLLLGTMGVAALDLVLRLPRRNAWQVTYGALLFIASDGLIALTRFGSVESATLTSAVVMSTYIAAQGLIVAGFVRGQAVAASRSRSR